MSSIFELGERVRRLRETFLYFRNAALLTGAELRSALPRGDDEQAIAEWTRLLAEVRQCLEAAEAVLPGAVEPPPRLGAVALGDLAEAFDPAATRH